MVRHIFLSQPLDFPNPVVRIPIKTNSLQLHCAAQTNHPYLIGDGSGLLENSCIPTPLPLPPLDPAGRMHAFLARRRLNARPSFLNECQGHSRRLIHGRRYSLSKLCPEPKTQRLLRFFRRHRCE